MRSAADFPELSPFVAAVIQAYGERMAGLYLFGSRARGEAREESDYDVAVVLNDPAPVLWQEQDRLADIAYDSLLEAGIHIQPLPFTLADWATGAEHRELVRPIRRDVLSAIGGDEEEEHP